MGTRNRERRKAKQKAREQRAARAGAGSHTAPGGSAAGAPTAQLADAVVADAMVSLRHNDVDGFDRCVKLLAGGLGAGRRNDRGNDRRNDRRNDQRNNRGEDGGGNNGGGNDDGGGNNDGGGNDDGNDGRRVTDRVVLGKLQRGIGWLWTRGWQPADVARTIDRQLGSRHARLLVDMVAAEIRAYATATVHDRWQAQLTALGARVWWDHDDRYVEQWGEREGLDRTAVLRHALEVYCVVGTRPELPLLCPPPGAARRGSPHPGGTATHGADQRMLSRVRALLAKAESTEFAEEAEALTAKAQELMARHSIDYALLAAQTGGGGKPEGVRVGVDNPYEAAKALLLQQVAEANRCNSVWDKQHGFATVLGFPGDCDATELLYTSLLVQATAAVVQAGSRRDSVGRSRTRSFRQSFLNAYAIRIGERLLAATADASRQAGVDQGDDRLLPVLAARDDAVRETVEALFPGLYRRSLRINDREGWVSGRAAADRAALHARREVGADAR